MGLFLERQRRHKMLQHGVDIRSARVVFQAGNQRDAIAYRCCQITLRHLGAAAQLAQQATKSGGGGCGHWVLRSRDDHKLGNRLMGAREPQLSAVRAIRPAVAQIADNSRKR